jgi:hypothetical protein
MKLSYIAHHSNDMDIVFFEIGSHECPASPADFFIAVLLCTTTTTCNQPPLLEFGPCSAINSKGQL